MLTNKLGLPKPFVDAATQSHRYTPKRYSVTQLLKGTREVILTRRHADEIESDVADSVWLIFGRAVHKILEESEETETQLKENFITAKVGEYTVSGIFDLYDDATGTVTDYKTASVWKVIYNEWDDYRRQILIYCWILRQMGFDARRGEVVVLLKDHSKTDAKRKRGYPQHPVHTVSWEFTEDDFRSTGEFLRDRFAEIAMAERMPDDALPICTDEERWHKPGKFAVMRKGRKSAVKLYDNRVEADIHAMNSGSLYVEERPGEDRKCMDYCPVRDFCIHYRSLAGNEGNGE